MSQYYRYSRLFFIFDAPIIQVVRGTGPGQQILRVVRPIPGVAGAPTMPAVVKPGPGAKTIFLSKGGTQQKFVPFIA